MLIDFNELREITIPNMNGGEGKVIAKMDVNDCGRFIQTVIHLNHQSDLIFRKQMMI